MAHRTRSRSGRLRDALAKAKREGWAEWIRSEADERAVLQGCRFDLGAAEHVRTFFRTFLRHSKGKWANQPFELLEWQWTDVIAPLFGWTNADGLRRFRTAYIEIPKKNGKSTMGSGLALYLLVGDGEPGAEIYSAAADRKQAGIVFDEAANMVSASKPLAKHLIVTPSTKHITHMASRSKYVALSADVPTAEGLNIHGLIFDELHAQPNRNMWDTLRYGGAARDQPLLISITTAGVDRQSICYEQHQYAERVTSGAIEDATFFGYIRAADEKDDWTKPAVWRKANPSLGETIGVESMRADCKEAQVSATKQAAFRRRRLNVWVQAEHPWLKRESWDACAYAGGVWASVGELDWETMTEGAWHRIRRRWRGRECMGGLDLSTTTDLTCLVLLFEDEESGGYDVVSWFWAPRENVMARQERDRVPYWTWAQQGLIELTEGNVTDYRVIRRRISGVGADGKKAAGGCIADGYGLRQLAVDRLFQGAELCTNLLDDGLDVVPFGQGFYSMAAPSAEFVRLVLGGRLYHGDHPILRWMADNVVVKTDSADNIKPDKQKSRERIDGIVAAIMALGRATAEEAKKPSVYETRGLTRL